MKEYKKPMTVQELRDYLDELISKRKFIGHMTVGFWVPELELEDDNDFAVFNHHNTFNIHKEDIYVNEWFNGDTFDDSNDSYEYLEIKVG